NRQPVLTQAGQAQAADGAHQAQGPVGQLAGVGHPQHQGEFVSAQAAGQLQRPGQAAHFLGDGTQGGIAGQVTGAVVDGLEVVDVHQQQGQLHAVQRLPAELVQVAVQAAPVGQPGQVVG